MPPDEQIALVDEHGAVVGSAARSVVRRDNLRHAATAVLVRDPAGRIYLHQRTDAKDWAPGHWDVAAGGVVRVGEEPEASARRELAEELGITVPALTALGAHLYEDDTVRCFEHAYEVVWEGPIRHQPEEVADGRWVTPAELAAILADPTVPFVPDTAQLLGRLTMEPPRTASG
jgi:8-oxo-dGTP pyrophosphatase MutT (NUDIX family)